MEKMKGKILKKNQAEAGLSPEFKTAKITREAMFKFKAQVNGSWINNEKTGVQIDQFRNLNKTFRSFGLDFHAMNGYRHYLTNTLFKLLSVISIQFNHKTLNKQTILKKFNGF